jgi:hypothetical protein
LARKGNIQVKIGGETDDLARHKRLVGRDQHQVDIGHAAEKGIFGQQGTGQVCGDDVLVVI